MASVVAGVDVMRLFPIAALALGPLLIACAEVVPAGLLPGADAQAEAEPLPLPPEVAPYMPPGVPGTLVMRDVNGCYVFTIEETDPPTGFPIRDNQGNQVCPAGEGA